MSPDYKRKALAKMARVHSFECSLGEAGVERGLM
jgi:hypothetical protein